MPDNHDLEQYFRFTPDDLAQNKKGLVSVSQKKELLRKKLDRAFRTLILLILIVLAVVIYLRFSGGMMLLPVLALYFSPVLAIIIGIIFFPVFKKTDLTLKSVQGKVNLVEVFRTVSSDSRKEYGNRDVNDPKLSNKVMTTEMHVGSETFAADEDLLEIVHKGDICRIYYLAPATIVSMEFVQ